ICLASWPEKSPGESVLKSAWLILSALIAGMLLGIGVELVSPAAGTASLPWIEPIRSEEHTSELQSLMRISYAVFCLKKKTNFYQYNIISLHYFTLRHTK